MHNNAVSVRSSANRLINIFRRPQLEAALICYRGSDFRVRPKLKTVKGKNGCVRMADRDEVRGFSFPCQSATACGPRAQRLSRNSPQHFVSHHQAFTITNETPCLQNAHRWNGLSEVQDCPIVVGSQTSHSNMRTFNAEHVVCLSKRGLLSALEKHP